MSTIIVKDILTEALELTGAMAIDEPPTASEIQSAFRSFNNMLS